MKDPGPVPASCEVRGGLRGDAGKSSTFHGSAARQAPPLQAQSPLLASEWPRFKVGAQQGWNGRSSNNLPFSSVDGSDPAPITTVDALDAWVLLTCVPKYDAVVRAAHREDNLVVTKGCHQPLAAHFDMHVAGSHTLADTCHFDCQTCLPIITGEPKAPAPFLCLKQWFSHLLDGPRGVVLKSDSNHRYRERCGHDVGAREGCRDGGRARRSGRDRESGGPPRGRREARGTGDDAWRRTGDHDRDEDRKLADEALRATRDFSGMSEDQLRTGMAEADGLIDYLTSLLFTGMSTPAQIADKRAEHKMFEDELKRRLAAGERFAVVRAASADEPPAQRREPPPASLRGGGGTVLSPHAPASAVTSRAA